MILVGCGVVSVCISHASIVSKKAKSTFLTLKISETFQYDDWHQMH